MSFTIFSTARFNHDCNECRLLGCIVNNVDGSFADMYLHGEPETGTLVVRTGSDGPDYVALPVPMVGRLINEGGTADILARAYRLLQASI